MRKFSLMVVVLCLGFLALPNNPGTSFAFDKNVLVQADQLWQEKSYQMAIPGYRTLLKDKELSKARFAEFQFKLADCLWRAGGQKNQKEAEKILKELVASPDHKRNWAEANESLAEFYLKKDRRSRREEIINGLENARDYWAGATDINLARERFIKASFTLGDYLRDNWGWHYTGIRRTKLSKSIIPVPENESPQGLNILYEEILKVAKEGKDKAKARYSLGMCYMNRFYSDEDKAKVKKNFEAVIKTFAESEWVDDAYYQLGQFYQRQNDFVEAVKVYRGLLSRFHRGQSRWVDDARRIIEHITRSELSVSVGYTFLPDSEIQFNMRWRNISAAKVSLYQLDLPGSMNFNMTKTKTDSYYGINNYQRLLKDLVETRRYKTLPVVKSWRQVLKNEGKHLHHGENKGLADWVKQEEEDDVDPAMGILAPGAYLLLVTAPRVRPAYDLILVTDMGFVTKVAGKSALFYAFDGKTGEPRPSARVKYHYRYEDHNGYRQWAEGQGMTNEEGLLNVRLKTVDGRSKRHELFACVSDGAMQAFARSNYHSHRGKGVWWMYAFSDRPAYRPNEEVSFKAIVRKYDGTSFRNPEGLQIKARIYDPRGNTVKEATYTLNAYGAFNDTLTLDEKAPLGEYRLEARTVHTDVHISQTTIFRLEEYKLPEFLVNIQPKAPEGRDGPAAYRLGDKIEIEVDAQYYFGGAVAEAEVEYLVYQDNYYHYYCPARKYSWYYEDIHRPNYYGGHGQLIKKEKIKTDGNGKASFVVETPEDINADLKYRVEVRVVDQSRREISASKEIKVTRNSFYAYLTPEQNLYRPGDKAQVDIKTMTANEEPFPVEGKVTVLRNWWRGPTPVIQKEVSKKRISGVVAPGNRIISPEPEHYANEELFTKFVKTNDKGEARFDFEPEINGYYTVQFTGYDTDGSEVVSSTNVYVCSDQSKDIGYRYGGLQIITEKDTYEKGETARFMIVSDNPGSWVLFSAQVDEIYDYRMMHLEGPVKLVEVPVVDAFIPNVYFNAISASQYQIKTSQLQIVVPPEEKFLNVKITSDKEIYTPQEEGRFEIEVTDKDGNPVVGEVALGIVDKSVYYIQSEYAPDIRKFFYGDKRRLNVRMSTSFQQRRYERLVRNEEGRLMTEAQRETWDKKKDSGVLVETQAAGHLAATDEMVRGSWGEGEMVAKKSMVASPSLMMESKGGVLMDMESIVAGDMAPGEAGSAGGELAQAQVRQDFRSTVVWLASVVTDENGKAWVKTKFPDSLTTWTTTARAITQGTKVGNITHEVKTKKDVIVRLQAPRFFVERDKVTISANVHNYTEEEKKIKVSIDAIAGLAVLDEKEVWVTIPPEGEERVDWTCLVEKAGTADITVTAQADTDADAMVKSYPVIPHGIEKFIAEAVVVKALEGQELVKTFTMNLPKERIKESTSLQMIVSPSIAASLLDALPYLAEYPYGCVEQTMSRFLPSVIVAKTMKDLGLSEAQVNAYISDVLEPRGDPEHPERKNQASLAKLNKMTKAGLKRLYDFQRRDGGWGWWKEDDSDRFMSAYVVWGLALARDAGIKIDNGVLGRAVTFLQNELVEEEDNPDMLAWMLNALSQTKHFSVFDRKQSDRLWEMRDELNPYTRALYAMSSLNRGEMGRAQTLARNLVNGVQEDKDNGTVHWGESGVHYRFSEGGVEATALVIKALSNIDPQSAYLEPAVKWMALNRRGARWKNTRDTAIAILGLADYLKTTNELNPLFDYEILVNGEPVRKGRVDASNVFTFNRAINLPDSALRDGDNEIKVVMKGAGAIYLSGYLKYFTLEEDITAAGNEMFVERRYQHKAQKETLLKGYQDEWTPLEPGAEVKSGDRVQVEIMLEAKNHYEYLVVEDYKPAGFEAVELKSGSVYFTALDEEGHESGTTWAYREFRDQKVVFFISKLPQGKYKITYELRAEVPGEFHGMPNQVHAMYVPEIRGNSTEMRLNIVD
ncbi:MAG: hypothetical protein KAJ18_10015 [Candidatus Omnitrophica bacterium]|nr:hypothetical protein [Candidatus Omnitrophota bacterium]